MIVRVFPSSASGSVIAQSSKSSMQRAVAAALLARGESVLTNVSYSDDSLSVLNMAECFGARISRTKDFLRISGGLKPLCSTLDCGESGLGVRMFAAISSLCDKEILLTGSGSIMNRPMQMIEDSLIKLGARVESTQGRLPITIKGPIFGGDLSVDGSLSSQFITGLLFALPLLNRDSHLKIDSLISKPYIDLTISVLNAFGIEIENRNYKDILVKSNQVFKACEYRIEEDWSGISFLAVLGAISGGVTIKNISATSVQADRMIIDVLKMVGADISIGDKEMTVRKADLRAFNFDISDCPDLAPPLTALASLCKGRSVISGTRRLVNKESKRSETLYKEFSKLGVSMIIKDNSMEIIGQERLDASEVHSHGDHRIAMALAVAASQANSPVDIIGAESVNKSYPAFFEDLESLSMGISRINN